MFVCFFVVVVFFCFFGGGRFPCLKKWGGLPNQNAKAIWEIMDSNPIGGTQGYYQRRCIWDLSLIVGRGWLQNAERGTQTVVR